MGGTILTLILAVAGPPCGPLIEPRPPLEAALLDPGVRRGFVSLFAGAEFGYARYERAAWLVEGPDDSARFLPWPFTGSSGKATWRGAVPDRAIAVVHTHPNGADPRPSNGDSLLARRLALPVLTLSRASFWVAWPDGRTSEIRGTGPFGWAAAGRSSPHEGSPDDVR
jgi:proteasome lid subunit RPN8/RPN11